MAQETINSIREAEKRSQQILKDAEDQKKSILEKARAESDEFTRDLLEKASAQAKAALEEIESKRETEIETAVKRAEAVIAQHKADVGAKRAEAISLVISEIA
mgnify:CR=1 FL=1